MQATGRSRENTRPGGNINVSNNFVEKITSTGILRSDKQNISHLRDENGKLRDTVDELKTWDVKREAELIEARRREDNMKYLNRKLMERLISQQVISTYTQTFIK